MLQGVLNFVLCDSMKEVDSFLLIKEIKTSGGSRPSDRGAWGGGHPDPEIRGRSGGGGVGVPPGPFSGSASENNQFLVYVHYLPSSLVL